MADETVLNVGTKAGGTPGAGGEPTSPASTVQQQAPIEGEVVEKLFSLLESKFAERFNEMTKPFLGQLEGLKKVQGDIDRSQKTFKEQFQQLQKYKDAGLSDEEAIAEMESDNQADEWKKGVDTTLKQLLSLVQNGGLATQQKETAADVFAKYGLDVKDPNVAPELAKNYKSAEEMEMAALRTFHKINTSPAPNVAQNAAMNGDKTTKRGGKKDITNINDSSTLYDLAASEIVG